MTPETLAEINPNLLSVASFMEAHPEHIVRFWDNGTVDITLSRKTSIPQFISAFKCPSCNAATVGKDLPPSDNANLVGLYRNCTACGIKFFIHTRVKFGGTT